MFRPIVEQNYSEPLYLPQSFQQEPANERFPWRTEDGKEKRGSQFYPH